MTPVVPNGALPSELIDFGFTKFMVAEASDGHSTFSNSPGAIKWCQLGARLRAVEQGVITSNQSADLDAQMSTYIRGGVDNYSGCSPVAWNNDEDRTKDEMSDLLAICEQELGIGAEECLA